MGEGACGCDEVRAFRYIVETTEKGVVMPDCAAGVRDLQFLALVSSRPSALCDRDSKRAFPMLTSHSSVVTHGSYDTLDSG